MRHAHFGGKRRHIHGWHPPMPRSNVAPRFTVVAPTSPLVLPTSLDLPNCPEIRDQGGVGDCTANSMLEAEGYLYLKEGKPDPMLSRFFLYYYSRKMENTPPTEDSGCALSDVMACFNTYGASLESTWPSIDDGSSFTKEPSHAAYMEGQARRGLLDYECPTLDTVLMSLAQGYPVVLGFSVPANMESAACAATGMVQYPSPTEAFIGGHAVMARGYDQTRRLVKCQNSWGKAWGDQGCFYLPFEFFLNGLASDMHSPRREMII